MQTLLAGIPQSGPRLGDPRAPVTLFYYGDLQCSVCSAFTLEGGFARLVENDVRAGHVKVVYRARQTATANPDTFQTQQVAALAAGAQQRFWQYAELFYRQQGEEHTGYVTNGFLTGLARQVPGLNLGVWRRARTDPMLSAQVRADRASARAAQVRATPTLIFEGPRGTVRLPQAVPDYEQLERAVRATSNALRRPTGAPRARGASASAGQGGCGAQTARGCTGQ